MMRYASYFIEWVKNDPHAKNLGKVKYHLNSLTVNSQNRNLMSLL